MTVLVTADIHLSDNPRDDNRHAFMRTLRDIMRKESVGLLIILGDLTEEKDRHGAWLVNQVVDHLHRFAAICPVIILRGNHDYVSLDNPFFSFLGRIDGLTWVNTPTPASALPKEVLRELGPCLFLPHTSNHERDWSEVKLSDYNLIFTHNTFQGANGGYGQAMRGIPLSVLPKTAEVISGDIHVPQDLGQVTYVGAPYLVDFGDNYEPRVMLLDKHNTRSVACPGPQKRLVEVKDIAQLKKYKGLFKGDVLKVRVHIDAGQHAQWPEIQKEIRAWGDDQGYMVHLVQPLVEQTRSAVGGKRKAAVQKTDGQLLQEYADRQGMDPATVKTGLNLLRR